MPPPATQIVKYKPYPLWHYLRTSSAMLPNYQRWTVISLFSFSFTFFEDKYFSWPDSFFKDKYFRFNLKGRGPSSLWYSEKDFYRISIGLQALLSANRMRGDGPTERWKSLCEKILKHIFPSSTISTSSTSSLFRLVYMSQEFQYKFLWINQSVVMGM